MYFDSVSVDGVTGCILKLEALQGMDRFEEAITECEAHISFIKGKGMLVVVVIVVIVTFLSLILKTSILS